MIPIKALLLYAGMVVAQTCPGNISQPTMADTVILVGSTPGDALMKTMLNILQETEIDFIRWRVALQDTAKSSGSFSLQITYGLGKNNTLGFENGGTELTLAGQYHISGSREKGNDIMYQLRSTTLIQPLTLLQVNKNLFHFLTPNKNLIAGNGGWSYSLNREMPEPAQGTLAGLSTANNFFHDTTTQITFDGRTPCRAFQETYRFTSECFKLKWRLILYRDQKTGKPVSYHINRTGSRDNLLTGSWTLKPHPRYRQSMILQLDPDKPDKTLSLLVGDANVLFFLDKNGEPLVGNKDFSYTLNRITR